MIPRHAGKICALERNVMPIFEPTIGVLSLIFKPNTDDIDDSPAVAVMQTRQDAGATVRSFGPAGHNQARKVLNDAAFVDGAYEISDGADALVIIVSNRHLPVGAVVAIRADKKRTLPPDFSIPDHIERVASGAASPRRRQGVSRAARAGARRRRYHIPNCPRSGAV